MPVMTYKAALDEAVAVEMRRDRRVFYLSTAIPAGLAEEFGSSRVRRTPISENAVTGMALGASGSGLRPVVNWRATTFTFVAFDQIVNHVAKFRYMVGGQADFPILFRAYYMGGMRTAAQHTQSAYAMFAHVPGLKLVAPSNPADAMGLLRTAIRDDNPVVSFEAMRLDGVEGEVPDDHLVPLGVADTPRSGTDVTVVALGSMVGTALDAAAALAEEGVSVEVIDPRTLVPLDVATIRASVGRTGRLVVADESPPRCSMAAEIITTVVEDRDAFGALRAPAQRVTVPAVPIPFSPPLEDRVLPGVDAVVAGVRAALGER
jgi:pyruvate dehydrogenase E1 component beta subunit